LKHHDAAGPYRGNQGSEYRDGIREELQNETAHDCIELRA